MRAQKLPPASALPPKRQQVLAASMAAASALADVSEIFRLLDGLLRSQPVPEGKFAHAEE